MYVECGVLFARAARSGPLSPELLLELTRHGRVCACVRCTRVCAVAVLYLVRIRGYVVLRVVIGLSRNQTPRVKVDPVFSVDVMYK